MPLSNQIRQLKYGGDWTFKGDDTTMTMLDMKTQLNASLRDIGKAFNVSHETVNLRFKDIRDEYPELWQDVKSKRQFYDNYKKLWYEKKTLAEIAQSLHISIGQSRKLESKLIPREERKYRVSVPRRLNNLSRSLFSYQFNAGEEFVPFVKKLFKKYLSESEQKEMIEYFVEGTDKPQESRFDRYKFVQKIKKDFEFDISDLLERNILCLNQEM